MDKKGIAVSQIVLLVLGILVLAVVAYLLYTNFLTSSGTFDVEKCRSAAIRACTSWTVVRKTNPTATAPTLPSECSGAAGTNAGVTSITVDSCKSVGVTV